MKKTITNIKAPVFAPSGQAANYGVGGYLDVTTNVNSTTLANTKTALNKLTSNVNIAFMGDSTMRGVDETALPYNSQYSISAMPMRLAEMFNAAGRASGADNWFGFSGTNLNDYVIRDSRVAVTGGSAVGGDQVQGGASLSFPAVASTFSFSCLNPCNTADIYWRDSGAGKSFTWQVDGGATTQIDSSGVTQIAKTTISLGSVGLHTILLTWIAGGPAIYGVDCYNNTRKEIHIQQWGTSGGTTGTLIGNAGAPGAGRLQFLSLYPPKLVIAESGPNDWRTSISISAFTTSFQTLITAVKAANSDFLFLIPPYDNAPGGLTANQDAYVAAMYGLAVTNNVGVLDLRRNHLSYKNAVVQGWQVSSDNVHLTKAGYLDEARLIFNALSSALFL